MAPKCDGMVRPPGFFATKRFLGGTIADPEHPILAVHNDDPYDGDDPEFTLPRGATFRVIPSSISEPENNLRIANMDFEEFADSTDDDGVFRGFR
jgi:hypothetical protein